jgi:TonB family protein
MSDRKGPPLAVMPLLCGCGIAASAERPALTPPASAPQARTALTSNPLRRCPTLRIANEDDRNAARVIFLVGPSGVPSHPSLVSPSGSQELDAAAMSCVVSLRFQPATRLGDGTAIESWQEIRWKWAPTGQTTGASAAPQAAAAAASPAAQGGGSSTPPALSAASQPASSAASDVNGRRESVPSTGGRAEVRVCVDAHGQLTVEPKLTRASGDPGFDAAAVQVAKSGSGLYRAGSVDGKAAAGCLELAIAPSTP